jgi:sRNA-binding carbon storage regulator CsrA
MDSRMESLKQHGMLVLTFRAGDSVVVGDCLVTVTKTEGNRIYVGFQADQSVRITRTNAKNKEPKEGKSK